MPTPQVSFIDFPVSAGFPSPADDFMEQGIDLNEKLIKHPTATFLIRVTGISMKNAGIQPGDTLIVDRALEPSSGSIVVALVNGEFTVKRYRKTPSGAALQAENAKSRSVTLRKTDQFEVWGGGDVRDTSSKPVV